MFEANTEQYNALVKAREVLGRQWKSKLKTIWSHGTYPEALKPLDDHGGTSPPSAPLHAEPNSQGIQTMQDILTAASLIVELSIAALPFIHIASKLMPRKPQPVPGQLELPLFDPTLEAEKALIDELIEACQQSEQQQTIVDFVFCEKDEVPGTSKPVVDITDPWELSVEETVVPVPSTIAPLRPPVSYLLLLPPSKEQTPAKPNYSAMTRDDLRRACQKQGIKWRDAKGKNRHLSVTEMKAALAAAA